MKEDARTPVKHEFEHAAPTVIHDPEQDMTILARWLHRGMERGPMFWYLLAGVVAVAVLLTVLANGLSRGRSSVGKAWSELNAAQTPSQKKEVADAFPDGEIARIARLQAANDYFFAAIRDLPANRESAEPQLKNALDLFRQVAKESPKDSAEALAAAFGAARTLETQNKLPEAIEQYNAVADRWPGTPEASRSKALAERLKSPEVVAFYKELYTYKPSTAALPPGLPGLPDLPAGHPALNGPTVPAPSLPGSPGVDALKGMTGPLDIAPPPLSEPAKPASKEAATPKAGELPADPFAPVAKPK